MAKPRAAAKSKSTSGKPAKPAATKKPPAGKSAAKVAVAKTMDASVVAPGPVLVTKQKQSTPEAFAKTVAVATPAVDASGLTWMVAGKGYQVALDDRKLVARNAAGKRLSSVPKEVKDGDLVDQIESMRDWLVEHDRECNGYKAKQLEAHVGELLKKELVLEAKRERAGRAYFLPGSWEANKSPTPPLETWKLPLYTVQNPLGGATTRRPPFDRYAAHAPIHVLFERAWSRIQSGDVPRYEEVKR